ncbi:MAG: S-layer homology domain-containing protein, partial [Defluviitaleaceae bacterium]|nr:S-layer homology domain-containing protein [Defluviitaleaceae bacterium]
EWAAYMGIVSGVGNDRFDPSAPITREQMAAMLRRFITVFEVELPMLDPEEITPFTDQDSISAWAAHSVEYIQAAGIIGGFPDGSFAPQATATRAEVASLFARFMEMLNN